MKYSLPDQMYDYQQLIAQVTRTAGIVNAKAICHHGKGNLNPHRLLLIKHFGIHN